MKKITIISESSQVSTSFQKEKVEDLLYEFLRDRTPLTEMAYRKDLKHFFLLYGT